MKGANRIKQLESDLTCAAHIITQLQTNLALHPTYVESSKMQNDLTSTDMEAEVKIKQKDNVNLELQKELEAQIKQKDKENVELQKELESLKEQRDKVNLELQNELSKICEERKKLQADLNILTDQLQLVEYTDRSDNPKQRKHKMGPVTSKGTSTMNLRKRK